MPVLSVSPLALVPLLALVRQKYDRCPCRCSGRFKPPGIFGSRRLLGAGAYFFAVWSLFVPPGGNLQFQKALGACEWQKIVRERGTAASAYGHQQTVEN